MPKRLTQWRRKASKHSVEVVELMGITSGHLELLSMMVRRLVNPLEDFSGPTRSIWMWEKRLAGTGMDCSGVLWWRRTLAAWQGRQSLAQVEMSAFIAGQRNLEDNRRLVARTLGWARPWTESKASRRNWTGSRTLAEPEEKEARTPSPPEGRTSNFCSLDNPWQSVQCS